MSFLNPLFLFGLAAAAIPILIHLFTRRRPREVRFPSLEFLTEVNQSEIRRLKLKQWLLLLLRTLAVAALAMAMARPAVKGAAASRGAATTVVTLVDRSGSMGALGAGGPLEGEARRVIEDLLGTLGPSDEMLLVPYDRAPAPVTAAPTGDLARLRAATGALQAGAATTDHGAALAFAARALAQSHALNRELFWISDFQQAGFTGPPAAPPGP
ncbi:MAG TPA: VWA domain-containing protein, partial [Candidatus Eisenbacteria bacterium]|nr:VWA domain-containing protein [Candidatus Eisenbacteria bacterium]